MPGLVPGIHAFTRRDKTVDGRDKPGHDAVDVAWVTTNDLNSS